jgi:hypothetical protein
MRHIATKTLVRIQRQPATAPGIMSLVEARFAQGVNVHSMHHAQQISPSIVCNREQKGEKGDQRKSDTSRN